MLQSRDMSCATDEWDDRPQTSEEIEALLLTKKEAALKREKALAFAFSNQVRFLIIIISISCWYQCMFNYELIILNIC